MCVQDRQDSNPYLAKGPMCKIKGDLLAEMESSIPNYVVINV